ncbi:MAG: transcriptional regulator [Actinobacteria bacterium]|nr:transcriptional regulator [Actinomycetota bacterium]
MSDDLATVLLQLRLRAFASSDVLAASTGAALSTVESLLVGAASDGLVLRRSGRVAGWTLTAAGRVRGQDLLAAEIDLVGGRDAVVEAYLEFLPLNAELLSICTDWQVVVVDGEHIPNDHADEQRDSAILARLGRLHPAALDVVAALADAAPRFGGYGARLSEAHDHVLGGHTEWLTRVTGDSYHGAWFELHEHLLAVLGRDRERETVPAYTPTIVAGTGRPVPRGPAVGDTP